MRLGFAVAIHVDPDVLLVDEVLAVGDEGFTHKCLDKFAEFRRRGKTILLVTHSLNLVERFCDEALWLDNGRAMNHGDPKRVVGAHLSAVEQSGKRRLMAATTAKALKGEHDGPVSAGATPDGQEIQTSRRSDFEHVRSHGRTVGLARGRDYIRIPCSADDGQPSHIFPLRRRDGRDLSASVRQRIQLTTSCSVSASSTPRASAVTAPTPISKK